MANEVNNNILKKIWCEKLRWGRFMGFVRMNLLDGYIADFATCI